MCPTSRCVSPLWSLSSSYHIWLDISSTLHLPQNIFQRSSNLLSLICNVASMIKDSASHISINKFLTRALLQLVSTWFSIDWEACRCSLSPGGQALSDLLWDNSSAEAIDLSFGCLTSILADANIVHVINRNRRWSIPGTLSPPVWRGGELTRHAFVVQRSGKDGGTFPRPWSTFPVKSTGFSWQWWVVLGAYVWHSFQISWSEGGEIKINYYIRKYSDTNGADTGFAIIVCHHC